MLLGADNFMSKKSFNQYTDAELLGLDNETINARNGLFNLQSNQI
jgi:hypothetical protein